MLAGRMSITSAEILGGGPVLAAGPESATKINPRFGAGISPSTATSMETSLIAGIGISSPRTSLFGMTTDMDGRENEGAGLRFTVYEPGWTAGNSNDPSFLIGAWTVARSTLTRWNSMVDAHSCAPDETTTRPLTLIGG